MVGLEGQKALALEAISEHNRETVWALAQAGQWRQLRPLYPIPAESLHALLLL